MRRLRAEPYIRMIENSLGRPGMAIELFTKNSDLAPLQFLDRLWACIRPQVSGRPLGLKFSDTGEKYALDLVADPASHPPVRDVSRPIRQDLDELYRRQLPLRPRR